MYLAQKRRFRPKPRNKRGRVSLRRPTGRGETTRADASFAAQELPALANSAKSLSQFNGLLITVSADFPAIAPAGAQSNTRALPDFLSGRARPTGSCAGNPRRSSHYPRIVPARVLAAAGQISALLLLIRFIKGHLSKIFNPVIGIVFCSREGASDIGCDNPHGRCQTVVLLLLPSHLKSR